MTSNASSEEPRGDGEICSPSTSDATTLGGGDAAPEPPTQVKSSNREALQKVQCALRTKIQELEAAEAEEKELTKGLKKAVREVQKTLSSREHTISEKLELFQQRFIERVNDQIKAEKRNMQLQRKLDKVTAERVAMGEDVRRLSSMNTKLQDLCRTLQIQNKSVVQDAQEKATAEAQQREELTLKMETAMKDISTRLEEHSAESQKCMKENMELRSKLEHVGQFCDEMDRNHKEQVERKETQITFLRERIKEQAELIEHYGKTEEALQEKCAAAEAARDAYCKQLEDAKDRINGFCESFEKSNTAFKQLQDQVDMSHKIQKKMQQESDLLKKRSDLVQQKAERLLAENEKLQEQVDGMRGKLEHSVSAADHPKLCSQKTALEKLCRVLQAENKELRKQLPDAVATCRQQQSDAPTAQTPVLSAKKEEGDDP